jgi:hypothetical protein
MLKENIANFVARPYTKVKRGADSYAESVEITVAELDRLVGLYKTTTGAQRLRLVRDAIDHWLRRYHGYTIQGSIGSHYVTKQGATATKTVFEHVVPASKVRDMFIAGVLTAEQAMHMPTCIVSKEQDIALSKSGRVSSTTNMWEFFERYNIFNDTITTHDGTKIDPTTWTLEDHFNYFKE